MNSSNSRDVSMAGPAVTDADLPIITGSLALAHGPLARALHEYARITGNHGIAELTLTGQCAEQDQVINWILAHLAEIPQLRDLESLASPDYTILNSFLVARGFEPLFTPFKPSDIGITSVLDATMLWKETGTVATIERQGKTFPAFKLSGKTAAVEQLYGGGPFTDRVIIETQSGHQLYLAMLPEDREAPSNGAELLGLARRMLGAESSRVAAHCGIVVPKVNFDVVSELPWLNGLSIATPDGESHPLTQCRQHTKLYMNELGARAAAAFAGVVSRSAAPPPYTIDRHFVLAVVDNFTSTAVFYLNPEDSWSEPPAGVIAAG